jgi:hypothetical protein
MRRKKKIREPDPLDIFRRGSFSSASPEAVLDHEEHVARVIGGERHRGSGAHPFRKSDASSDDLQVEAKMTARKSLNIKIEWIRKITKEALARDRMPMMHVRFLENAHGFQDWVLIPEKLFVDLSGESGSGDS